MRQDIEVRPDAGFQRLRIVLRQAGHAHGGGGLPVIVMQRVQGKSQMTVLVLDDGVPPARCAVIGGQADGARIMPNPAILQGAREGQAAMAGDHAIRPGQIQFLGENLVRVRGKEKPVDPAGRTVKHGQTVVAKTQIQPLGQRRHPGAVVIAHPRAGVGKPSRGETVAGRAGREAAAAIGRAFGELLLAIAHHCGDTGFADQRQAGDRIGAISHDIAGADHPLRRDAMVPRGSEQRLQCLEIAIDAPE